LTHDLSAETESLKIVALGTRGCESPEQCPVGETRYREYPDKWHRYSVIVELDANSKPDDPVYTIGVARRPSTLMEFFAPLGFDNPFAGTKWKRQVAPECRNPTY
jgi:hypothetical protein